MPIRPNLLRELHALIREGSKQGWASDAENWSLAEMIAVADDRAAATTRLDAVMKTSALATARRSALGDGFGGGVAAAVLLGVGLAYVDPAAAAAGRMRAAVRRR